MRGEHQPTVGDWYQTVEGATFEVVALDEDDGTVELQYADGTIAELDAETWDELDIEPIEAPEDWSGPMDMDREDMSSERVSQRVDWSMLDDFEGE